jgi:hypothetical protein
LVLLPVVPPLPPMVLPLCLLPWEPVVVPVSLEPVVPPDPLEPLEPAPKAPWSPLPATEPELVLPIPEPVVSEPLEPLVPLVESSMPVPVERPLPVVVSLDEPVRRRELSRSLPVRPVLPTSLPDVVPLPELEPLDG